MATINEEFLKLTTAFSTMGMSMAEAIEAIAVAFRQMGGSAECGKAMKEISNKLAGAGTSKSKSDLEIFRPNIEEIDLTLDDYNINIEEFKDWMIEI